MTSLKTAIAANIPKEPLLAIDDFKKTFMLTGIEAIVSRLITLLYMEPGTIRDIYNMGINIKKYLFDRIENTDDIQQDINYQLSTYFRVEYGRISAQCFLTEEPNTTGKTLNIVFNFTYPLDEKGHKKLIIKLNKERVIKSISDIDILVN